LYGIEEIKQSGDWKKMRNPELNQENIPESIAVGICNNLALSIETAAYLLNNESVVSIGTKKINFILKILFFNSPLLEYYLQEKITYYNFKPR
jgi:hypothetical protein